MRAAISSGLLRSIAGDPNDLFVPVETGSADAAAIITTTAAGCVFYRGHGTARCEVHRVLGHAALPLACRQFPRVVLRDPRGVSVTLSHYCPTAAALLDTDSPVSVTLDAAAFPPAGEYVGLDAAAALPPLLAPGMLMDWESWWELERQSVAWITRAGPTCRDAVDRLAAIVDAIRPWRPADGPLIQRVTRAFETESTSSTPAPVLGLDRASRLRDIAAGIPDAWTAHAPLLEWSGALGDVTPPSDAVVRRFVAAHAFASWTAHLGQGLRTWWRSVDAALLAIESGLDVGRADLVLRHLADPDALARAWSRSEQE